QHVEGGDRLGRVAARREGGQVASQRIQVARQIRDRARAQAGHLGDDGGLAALAGRVQHHQVGVVDARQLGGGIAGDEVSVADAAQRRRDTGGGGGGGLLLDAD